MSKGDKRSSNLSHTTSRKQSENVKAQPIFGVGKSLPEEAAGEQFDARKWRDVLMANVDMISHKVAAQAVHSVLERELDDLKSIVSNSFDQI